MDQVAFVIDLVVIFLSLGVAFVSLWFARLLTGGFLGMVMRLAAVSTLIFLMAQVMDLLDNVRILQTPTFVHSLLKVLYTGAILSAFLIVAYDWKRISTAKLPPYRNLTKIKPLVPVESRSVTYGDTFSQSRKDG